MKRQITQFDTNRTSATVATPTCSSCCCCCCCLTTTLASSTILARRINKEAREKNISDPLGLTILAYSFLPVVALITYCLMFIVNKGLGECFQRLETQYSGGYLTGYSTAFTTCSRPAESIYVAIPIILASSVLVLSYLYARVKMKKPLRRAMIVTTIIAIAFVAEGFAGGFAILTGVGGPLYLLSVPILFGIVQAFYGRKILHKTVTRKNAGDAWRD